MSELCGYTAVEQPTFDKILGRLEHIRRETLIDSKPGKPAVIKSVATCDLENLLAEAQTILEVITENRPPATDEAQHQQRMWESYHGLALHIIEKIKLELHERRNPTEALAHAAMRTLVL